MAATDGVVSYASLGIGSRLKKGEAVATLHSGVLASGSPKAKARAAYEAARAQYERAAELVQSQAVSAKVYEEARLAYELAKTEYEAFDGSDGDGLTLTAPMDGVLSAWCAADGDFVAAGTPVATLTATDRLLLCAELPASEASSLAEVVSARFKTAASDRLYSTGQMNGRLLARAATLQEGDGYLPVSFLLDNDGTLLPGVYADVWLESTPDRQVLSVPLEALSEEQGLLFVYVRLDEDCYRRQEVRTGGRNALRAEITAGLAGGEEVVVSGTVQVRLAAFSGSVPEGHTHHH